MQSVSHNILENMQLIPDERKKTAILSQRGKIRGEGKIQNSVIYSMQILF